MLLKETGELIQPGSDSLASAGDKSSVVLGRGLCRFEHIPTPNGLSGAQAVRAARLAAESRAPFARSDHIVMTGAPGCSIWWWDAERVREMMGQGWAYDPARLVPETALQPPGSGWRQVQTSDGYEAQFWRDGLLVSSVWRRRPFTPDQWESFVRAVGVEDAPDLPPDPVRLTLGISGFGRIARASTSDPWMLAERAAIAVLVASLFGGAAYAGRAIGYEQLATQARDAITAAGPAGAETASSPDGLEALLDRVVRLQNKPQALLAAAELHRILLARGVTPVRFAIEDDILQVQVQTRPDLPLQAIASVVEESPWFLGVDPDLDNSTGLGNLSAQLCNPQQTAGASAACAEQAKTP